MSRVPYKLTMKIEVFYNLMKKFWSIVEERNAEEEEEEKLIHFQKHGKFLSISNFHLIHRISVSAS